MGKNCEYWQDDDAEVSSSLMHVSLEEDNRPICKRIGVKIDPTICLTCLRYWPKGFNLQEWLDLKAQIRELKSDIRELKGKQGV